MGWAEHTCLKAKLLQGTHASDLLACINKTHHCHLLSSMLPATLTYARETSHSKPHVALLLKFLKLHKIQAQKLTNH